MIWVKAPFFENPLTVYLQEESHELVSLCFHVNKHLVTTWCSKDTPCLPKEVQILDGAWEYYITCKAGVQEAANFKRGRISWSNLAEPSCVYIHVRSWVHARLIQLCLTLCNIMDCIPWCSCPWNFPDKNIGVGCHALLQWIFLTQGSNPCLLCLLHWQVGSLTSATWEVHVYPQGSLNMADGDRRVRLRAVQSGKDPGSDCHLWKRMKHEPRNQGGSRR